MTNYEQAVKLANRICKAKRDQNTQQSAEFMKNLHGTHMAPGKFR